jgi:signal recognition particle subunit SEC65
MPDHFYVYPTYLKRSVKRAEGRRVPDAEAVSGELNAPMLLDAAKGIGFQAELENKQYPKEAWRGEGRIKVTKKKGVTKAQFLHRLARELRARAAKTAGPSS